jgi:hypothetical protein
MIENNQLFASQGNRVQVFNLPGLAMLREERFPEPVNECAIEPQTKKLFVASENRLYWEGGGVEYQPVMIPPPPIAVRSQPADSVFSIQVGAFGSKTNADNLGNELNKKGLAYYIVEESGVFKVRIGYFSSKNEALDASTGLKDHQPWVMSDRITETVKPTTGMDLNHDGTIEWVVNPDERVIIFSRTGSVYKKVWESPADKKLKVGNMEDGQIQVETQEGVSGTISWSGKYWQLRF